MFYDRNVPRSVKSNLRVQLTDFSKGINTKITQNLLPLNYAVNCYNFDFNKGSLSTGLGLKELQFKYSETGTKVLRYYGAGVSFTRFWQFKRYSPDDNNYTDIIIFYCDNGNIYANEVTLGLPDLIPLGVSFDSVPHGLNYRVSSGDSLFFFNKNKITKYDGVNLPTVFTENVPFITSIALHAGRLFATSGDDQSVVWFSDDLDPTNWNVSAFEGGYIDLSGDRGLCKKLVEANNALYVIREYGITKIKAFGLQSTFNVSNLYLSSAKMIYDTAQLCGHIIIILCADGLYYFDGSSMNKLNFGFEEMLNGADNRHAVSAYLNGKYYLACRLNYGDGAVVGCESGDYKNNTLIEVDLNTWEINICRGVDIGFMSAIHTKYFSTIGVLLNSGADTRRIYEITHEGEFFEQPSHKYWCSPFTDMGYPNYKKVLKTLTLSTKTDVKVTFNVDGKNYSFNVNGDKEPVRVPLNLAGNKFSVAFESDESECEISDPLLQVSLI